MAAAATTTVVVMLCVILVNLCFFSYSTHNLLSLCLSISLSPRFPCVFFSLSRISYTGWLMHKIFLHANMEFTVTNIRVRTPFLFENDFKITHRPPIHWHAKRMNTRNTRALNTNIQCMLAHAYHFTSFRRFFFFSRFVWSLCIPEASLYPVFAAAAAAVIVCGAVAAAGWKISPKGKRIYRVCRCCWSGSCMLTRTLYYLCLRLFVCVRVS